MRIALISDIHGNLVSLRAVLADINREGVDQIVCLGDVTALGPQPCEVLAQLKALDCTCVMGNHDDDMLNLDLAYEDAPALPWEVELVDWCAGQLSKADLVFLRSFQPSIEIPLDAEATLLCFHGSPRSNMDRILATTPAAELDEMLMGHNATVMAGGHTHVQMLRQHKGVMIVNPGSAGCPLEQMPFQGMPRYLPWAEYALVNWAGGILSIELRRVPIDLDAVKQAALTSDMPDAASWVELWKDSG
jgi:predicted phosphodiesterase